MLPMRQRFGVAGCVGLICAVSSNVLNDVQHSTELLCHAVMHGDSRIAYIFTHSCAEVQSRVNCGHHRQVDMSKQR